MERRLPVFGCGSTQPFRVYGLPVVPLGHWHKYVPGKFVQLPKQLLGSRHSSISDDEQLI
jgi:hypothetical protein